MIQAVLFDCDGVLMDTERLASEINVELLNQAGYPLTYEESRRYLTGKTSDGVKAWLEQRFNIEMPDWQEREQVWYDLFRQRFEQSAPIMAGAFAMFGQLELPVSVVSNSNAKELDFKIEQAGLQQYLPRQRRFSGHDLNMPKPEPGAYLKAAEVLDVSPENCLVIEDSSIGAQAGLNAGMKVWGFTADADADRLLETGVHLCFDRLEQLPDLINDHNRQFAR